MAGGPSKEMLAEIASRPGRDTLLSSAVKYVFILLSLGFVMLTMSFLMLLSINLLQAWSRRRLVAAGR